MDTPTEPCVHPVGSRLKVFDRLGPMEVGPMGDGRVEVRARVLESHIECTDCGATLEEGKK